MRNWVYLTAALLALQAVPAHAERDPVSGAPIKPDKHRMTPSPITDRFAVEGIFFNPAISSTLRVDPQSIGGAPGSAGTIVSGERDFGMNERVPQGRIEIIFRLRENNRLRVDYFASHRASDDVISSQILFGNETFQPGDRVTSELDFRQFSLTYTYSLLRNDHVEVGLGLGVHFVEADGRAAVEARQQRQEVSGSGAFPTIPVDLTWRIWHGLALSARGQYFHVAINNFSGSMADYHGDFQWRWRRYPNFSLGAGYSIMRTNLDINNSNFPGAFRLNVRGPEGFFKVSF